MVLGPRRAGLPGGRHARGHALRQRWGRHSGQVDGAHRDDPPPSERRGRQRGAQAGRRRLGRVQSGEDIRGEGRAGHRGALSRDSVGNRPEEREVRQGPLQPGGQGRRDGPELAGGRGGREDFRGRLQGREHSPGQRAGEGRRLLRAGLRGDQARGEQPALLAHTRARARRGRRLHTDIPMVPLRKRCARGRSARAHAHGQKNKFVDAGILRVLPGEGAGRPEGQEGGRARAGLQGRRGGQQAEPHIRPSAGAAEEGRGADSPRSADRQG